MSYFRGQAEAILHMELTSNGRSNAGNGRGLTLPVCRWSQPEVEATAGRKRVHVLAAYGVKEDGTRRLLELMRSERENQQAWEGIPGDLYQRG